MLHLPGTTPALPVPPGALSGTVPPDALQPAPDCAPTPPPADEGPLAGLRETAELDPALQARATIFFTLDGRVLAEQIDVFQAYPELASAAELHARMDAAVDALARQPGRGVLMLSGGHHAPSSLMQFHAAVDACRKHGWQLLLELERPVFEQLQPLTRFLEQEPALRCLLGRQTLHSRAGQQIAWNYVRQCGDRGALQKFLPEVLGCIDMLGSGVQPVHVDDLGLDGGTDEQREASMVRNTQRVLPDGGKAVLVLGLAHSMPMHQRFQARGIQCREVAVLDETANHAARLYDDAEGDNPAYDTAVTHSHNLRLPVFALAASRTDAYRLPPNLNPFR